MTRTPMIRFLPISIVALLICYVLTCNVQSPTSREDEEAIKKLIAGTTEAFNRHDPKAFARFYTQDAELVTVRGEHMKGAAEIEKVSRPSSQPEQQARHLRCWMRQSDSSGWMWLSRM